MIRLFVGACQSQRFGIETTGPPRHVEQVPMAMLPLEGGGGTCLDGS